MTIPCKSTSLRKRLRWNCPIYWNWLEINYWDIPNNECPTNGSGEACFSCLSLPLDWRFHPQDFEQDRNLLNWKGKTPQSLRPRERVIDSLFSLQSSPNENSRFDSRTFSDNQMLYTAHLLKSRAQYFFNNLLTFESWKNEIFTFLGHCVFCFADSLCFQQSRKCFL